MWAASFRGGSYIGLTSLGCMASAREEMGWEEIHEPGQLARWGQFSGGRWFVWNVY